MTHVEFAEREGNKCLACHIEDAMLLSKEANITFAFITAALSGVFGYAVKLAADDPHGLAVSTWVTAAYLAALGAVLVLRVMMARAIYTHGNEPKNLLLPAVLAHPIEEVRKFECDNVQERIEYNVARNISAARTLNRVRALMMATPLIFLAAWAATAAV